MPRSAGSRRSRCAGTRRSSCRPRRPSTDAARLLPATDGHGIVVADADDRPARHRRHPRQSSPRRASAPRCPMRASATSLAAATASIDADDVESARHAFDLIVAAGAETVCVLHHGHLVGTLSRRSALRSTLYRSRGRRVRSPERRRRGRHQRRRRRQGAGARRRRASTCSSSTPRTDTRRGCCALCAPSPTSASASRSPPATSSPPRACTTSCAPAPTSSRSASAPARCARRA